ncbi:NAD-dependent epimerase/dehydratase family protein [Haloprofundus salinisoli]|uniref:NAD-dependent epimerase/dehydratase family protein n=1 Tax=Haloprofundus salinisoli TaxID=2876193 RepID=UPI001CCA4258|nr:NAD(P)-dependent oxidoreductase [Haloprofundus salinisoli]
MNVFVTGATGVLGRRLVGELVDRGHYVVGLARDADGAELVDAAGATPSLGDVLDPDSLEAPVSDADAVVHAATSIPSATKPTDDDWRRNDEVRLDGARNLVKVADGEFDRFLFPSVVWVARQPDGSRFDEDADPHPTRATQSAIDTEAYLDEAAVAFGFDLTVLRCGYFYAPDATHTQQFGRRLLEGTLPIIGGGTLGRRDAELSFLHADDAARAFADALDSDATGLYHVVDDERVSVADFLEAFAARLGASTPRRIPGWLAKFFVGSATTTTLTTSMPTDGERFRRDVGWSPAYPTYRDGLRQIIDSWKTDGTIRERSEGYEWVGDAGARTPSGV